MDSEQLYDEFGNYIGPDLGDTDSDEDDFEEQDADVSDKIEIS